MAEIRRLSNDHEIRQYDSLVSSSLATTITHTSQFVEFVSERLNAQTTILGVYENDKLRGALPLAVSEHTYGNVINSLPYYGSWGGSVLDADLAPTDRDRIRRRLFAGLDEFASAEDCILSTVIRTPLDPEPVKYEQIIDYEYRDERVGQITQLPVVGDSTHRDALLYDTFQKSSRTAVRKAEREGVEIHTADSPGAELNMVYNIYIENMLEKGYEQKYTDEGGSIKKKQTLADILHTFENSRLRYATMDEKIIMGILELWTDDVIDYFMTAIDSEYRGSYATNLGVYTGMKWGLDNGMKYYNFGGTWNSQDGVYQFKRQFGAIGWEYYYYITAHDEIDHLIEQDSNALSEAYPGFYVLPYSELDK